MRNFGKLVERRLLRERLPGTAGEHLIHDHGPSAFDDMPERVVPPGHLFVLGDNRDRSADSRVPVAQMGPGMVPVARVIGRALFVRSSAEPGKAGRPLTR